MNKCRKSSISEHVRKRSFQTKAQGLSLTTIIVAAVGLIVLVILVAIFTGRMALFGVGVSKAARTELATLQLDYGQCRPSRGMESLFMGALDDAEDNVAKAEVTNKFERAISSCKAQTTDSCESYTPEDYTGVTCVLS